MAGDQISRPRRIVAVQGDLCEAELRAGCHATRSQSSAASSSLGCAGRRHQRARRDGGRRDLLLLRGTAQGQGGLLHPGTLGTLLAGGVLPALLRRTFRETFHGMPDHVMNYVESDAPAELTLVLNWRRVRAAAATRRRRSLRSPPPVRHRVAFA